MVHYSTSLSCKNGFITDIICSIQDTLNSLNHLCRPFCYWDIYIEVDYVTTKFGRFPLYHSIVMKSESAIKLWFCSSCFVVQLIVSNVLVYGGTLLKFVFVTFLLGSAAWGFNWLISTGWGECCTLQMPIASWCCVWRRRDRECNGFSSWSKGRRIAGNIMCLENLTETFPSSLTSWGIMFVFVWN